MRNSSGSPIIAKPRNRVARRNCGECLHWPSCLLGLSPEGILGHKYKLLSHTRKCALLPSARSFVYPPVSKKCLEISKSILQLRGLMMRMERTLYLILLQQISWLVCLNSFRHLIANHPRLSLLLASVASCLAMQITPSREHLHRPRSKPNFLLVPMPILLWMVF